MEAASIRSIAGQWKPSVGFIFSVQTVFKGQPPHLGDRAVFYVYGGGVAGTTLSICHQPIKLVTKPSITVTDASQLERLLYPLGDGRFDIS